MPERDAKRAGFGVPEETPTDLPMPPYKFQNDGRIVTDDAANGTAKEAADILRKANLLSCSASSNRQFD